MDWKKAQTHPKGEAIKRVYEHYAKHVNPYADYWPSGVSVVGERLGELSEEKLLEAINRFCASSWWMKKHSFRHPAWFFKSKKQIEKFLKIKSDAEWDRDYYYRTGYEIIR